MKKILLLSIFICLIGSGCAPKNDENNTAITPLSETKILTEKNFDEYKFSNRERINSVAQKFTVQINPNKAPFIFHVVSLATGTPGYIGIFKTGEKAPYQKIEIHPSLMSATEAPNWFKVQDVNLDGFSDIGIMAVADAKWASYQYWVFNQTTEQFEETPLTKDLRKLTFNTITFDAGAKRIIVDSFYAGITGSQKDTYQYQKGRLLLEKTSIKQNIVVEDEKMNTDTPTIHCQITTKTYTNGKEHIVKEELHHECAGPFGR